MEIYERSRQRNHNHNVSASSSLAWAHRSIGDGGMASTHGVPNQESKTKCAWPIALLIASGPPHDPGPITLSRNLAADFAHYLSERPEMTLQKQQNNSRKEN
jgi:hypothetical protein